MGEDYQDLEGDLEVPEERLLNPELKEGEQELDLTLRQYDEARGRIFQREALDGAVERAAEAVACLLSEGLSVARNRYNR